MKKIYIIILLVFGISFGRAQTWNLIWADEFSGTTIDTSNWKFDIGGSGWGNNELEYYTDRTENATVENGNLLFIAKKESFGGRNYTSARLKTQGVRSFTYGKIEARIKLPKGKGTWPAFWLLGNDYSQVDWPKCGEIDIMEHINNNDSVYGTIHWDRGGHVSSGGKTTYDIAQYKIFSIEWNPDSIKWFVDDRQYWQENIKNNINSTEAFHLPFFIILNLAIGGYWPGSPDSTTSFPDTMFVDYVRVYQLFTNIARDNNNIPSRFALSQNYPNPCNPSTSISFSIPTQSFVSLKVFNLKGREVTTIVSEEMSAGNYSRTWNAADLPSSIYFYRLQDGKFTETKKLILLK